MPITPAQHALLYQRALLGSLKDAAAVLGIAPGTAHGQSADAISRLGVDDVIAAFRLLGWLRPLPYDPFGPYYASEADPGRR